MWGWSSSDLNSFFLVFFFHLFGICEVSKVGHDPKVWLRGGANKRWWALDNKARDFDPNVW